jgi:hypothetical protein
MTDRAQRLLVAEREIELWCREPQGKRPLSMVGHLVEQMAADLFGLSLVADPNGPFDALFGGRRVEIKSTSSNKLQGIKRAQFDVLMILRWDWATDYPSVWSARFVSEPPGDLSTHPGVAQFERLPNLLRRPVSLLPVRQRLRDGSPCYRSLRPIATPLSTQNGRPAGPDSLTFAQD